MEAYENIGGLFKNLKQDCIENKLNIKTLEVVRLVIDVLGNMIESINIELITRKIIANIEVFGLLVNIHKINLQEVA